MKTFKLFTFIFLGLIIFQSTSLLAVQEKGDRQTRQVSGFHGVSVSSGINLYLTQKSMEEVVVESESDDLDQIITKVEDGILKITMKQRSWFNFGWNHKSPKVYVSFKNLDKLEASSGSDVYSQAALKLDNLSVHASSGSDVKLELDANEVKVETSSGSDIYLKGKANLMQASASSGSDIKAEEFQTKKCTASTSSGSDIKVYASEEINASASSGGDISYYGNPKVKNVNESSGGDVHGK